MRRTRSGRWQLRKRRRNRGRGEESEERGRSAKRVEAVGAEKGEVE